MSCEIPQLPDLALIEILSRTNVSDRVKLKLVCKRWNYLVECVRHGTLCVFGTQSPEAEFLAYKKPEPSRCHTIRVGSADAVPNLKSQLFQKVDHLYLLAIENSKFLPDLNYLIRLKELVICRQSFESLSLKLPNLSVLCLKRTEFRHLELNTEKLTTFVFWGGFSAFRHCSVHFQHPETLKVLEYESYVFRNALQEFTNLEHLTGVQQFGSPIDLRLLPKLKTLDVIVRDTGQTSRNLQISSIVHGISQRSEVDIFSLGLKDYLLKVALYRSTFVGLEHHSFLIHYNTRQNPIPFSVTDLSFKEIAKTFRKRRDEEISQIKIPKSFFRKVPYIASINASTMNDARNLIELLRESRCPLLRIWNEGHQAFFDQASRLTSISSLRIFRGSRQDIPDLNFNFLTNMSSLISLELEIFPTKWPLDSILQAVKKCKFFAHLILHDHYIRTVEARFRPYTRQAYRCSVFNQELSERTAEELVRYLRENEETKGYCDGP